MAMYSVVSSKFFLDLFMTLKYHSIERKYAWNDVKNVSFI